MIYGTYVVGSKFPTGKEGNYIVDVAEKGISKGEAVKKVVEMIKPQYGYICVGNDENDVPMFKQAIDNGMLAAVMKNSPVDVIEEIKEYAKGKDGRMIIIPESKNHANEFLVRVARLFEKKIKENEKREKRENRLPNVQRINNIKPVTSSCDPNKNKAKGRIQRKNGGRYL